MASIYEMDEGDNSSSPQTASATTSKSKKDSAKSKSWINFNLVVTTKEGVKTFSAGISGDAVFLKLFGSGWESIVTNLSEAQTEGMISKFAISDFKINMVTPAKDKEFNDVF